MQSKKLSFQFIWVGLVENSNLFRPVAIERETRQNGINAVQAGAGHEADIELGLIGRWN